MDPLRLLTLQSVRIPSSNGSEKYTHERGTGGMARGDVLDGRDGVEHIPGSEVIAQSMRLIDDDLYGVVAKLRSSLQDAHTQLVQSEDAYQALYLENVELKKTLAAHLNQQHNNTPPHAQFEPEMDRLLKTMNTPIVDPQPSSSAASNLLYMTTPAKKDNGLANASMPSPQQLQPGQNFVSVQNMRFETNIVGKVKLLNNIIREGASGLGKSIVSVTLNPMNSPAPSKEEWQAAFQVTTSRLGSFLATTISQEAQKTRLILNAQLIHITLSTFFTSLVAEWSGWCRVTRSPPSGDNKDGEENSSSSGPTNSNRDVETALSEFAKICSVASWNTNPDWDAAFERQLTSFLSHAIKMGPFIIPGPHDTMPQGSAESGGYGYRPLFVPAGVRFSVEKMENIHQDKGNAEKGARKIASCVGFGLSSEMPQDGTLRVVVKPRVVLESTLFENLNPPQPAFQPRARSAGHAGTNSTHIKLKRGWSRSFK